MCDGTTEQAPQCPRHPVQGASAPIARPLAGVSYAQRLPEPNRTIHQQAKRMKKNEWQSADRILAHSAHLPVEVELVGGKVERRTTVSGDWRQVTRWRMVDKEAADRQRKGK